MAAFSKHAAGACVVVRAEHLFIPRSVAARAPRLTCRWRRDADGRLVRTWSVTAEEAATARIEPSPSALAA